MKVFFFSLLFLLSSTVTSAHEPGSFLSGQKISLGGVSLNFVEIGQGQPILFLHGLGGSWKDWSPILPFYPATFQAMAIDFPGFGESDKPETDYSIEWFTQIIEKFLAEKKLDQVNVVGHSMGGLVALNLAAQPSSRVKKLVVTDAVGISDKAEFLSYALTKKIVGPESRFDSFEGFLREEFRMMIEDFIKRQKPKTSKEFFQSVPKSPLTGKPLLPMTPSVQMAASIIDFDVRLKLSSITQPTLILWGAKDPVAPLKDAAYLKSQIPHASLKIFEGCGHSPMQEQPARFHQELWNFLQATESGSSK